jgi:hypothetical protein
MPVEQRILEFGVFLHCSFCEKSYVEAMLREMVVACAANRPSLL